MTEAHEHPHVTVARALTRALESGDAAAVADLYADDISVFRNFDARTLPKAKVLKVIDFLTRSVVGLRYEDVRITPTERGFVQQHVFRGTSASGEPVAAHVCLLAEVRDGRITRIDEYLDSAQMAPLMGAKA